MCRIKLPAGFCWNSTTIYWIPTETEELKKTAVWNRLFATQRFTSDNNKAPVACNSNHLVKMKRIALVRCVPMCVLQKFKEKNGFLEDPKSMVQAYILWRGHSCVLYPCTLQLIQTNVEQKQKTGLLSLNMGDNDFGINTYWIFFLLPEHTDAAQSKTGLLQKDWFPISIHMWLNLQPIA